MELEESINVFGSPLQPCSLDPLTGYYRDGCCNTGANDYSSHTICVQVTQNFLEYSRFRGNDLSTPVELFGFPGLKPGDRWCLSVKRWVEAHQHNMAPKVYLNSTHFSVLELIPLSTLKQYAIDSE